MRSIKTFVAGLAIVLLCSAGASMAALNEVGAVLVYPSIATLGLPGGINFVETFVTITNASPLPKNVHISYINGEVGPSYCYECDFTIPLSGNDTETLLVQYGATGIVIQSEFDNLNIPVQMSCPFPFGMLVAAVEDAAGNTMTDNALIGEQVVVDYQNGAAFSIPAVPFQGLGGGGGDRQFDFDGTEYSYMPRIVAADFLAPNFADIDQFAVLSLFTLDFERQIPPVTDCSVTGYDGSENAFSASFQFGCWVTADLCAISPEFCFPNLGIYNILPETHGWLQLNCRVDNNSDGTFDTNGGVHGAIVQFVDTLETIAAGSGTPFATAAAWGRLLYQSVTMSDPATLVLEAPGQGLN